MTAVDRSLPMANNVVGQSEDPNLAGVLGEGVVEGAGTGVYGRDRAGKGNGVIGYSEQGRGVWGHSKTGHGLLGESETGRGVIGRSHGDYGIRGHSDLSAGIRGSSGEGRGVEGWGTKGEGVVGVSDTSDGVRGETKGAGTGVLGLSTSGVGVWGASEQHEGVRAETKSPGRAAVAAFNLNPNGTGAAIFAKKEGNQGHAGFFDGHVWVERDLTVKGDITLTNADCAEDFDVADVGGAEPGSVMVLGNAGGLVESHRAFDKRVAGVISGAGDYKPGIVLDKRRTSGTRQPIALLGKVFCKVDAEFGAIEAGDLLTTSPTRGHAMKATDPMRAFGAVIGKALGGLEAGQGLIPILVALQ